MGRRKNKKGNKSDNSGDTRMYIKVLATFCCSGENCKKTWNSAHGWEREDEGIYCEFCDAAADLVDAVDEVLKLDTYQCPNKYCDNYWQSIHFGKGLVQQCDVCETMVSPVGPPQERFGRHYKFKCKNKGCLVKPEWEDFSTSQQKSQRCTKCYSRGDIKRIEKLKPAWVEKRRRDKMLKDAGKNASGDIKIKGFGFGKGPSKHNSNFCDMCQDIISQGVGRSCHNLQAVLCTLAEDPQQGGNLIERIVQVLEKQY